ncbi:hypothetical protein TIFTF001_027461 [Ficus carica]|uniref:Uncharacterized protein n=1 Tax=Ficus carica TaxID=3494 RepID=A0AA88DN88_FICCA|nr:hypothetical protein TIFTF001_027461 [Ficus carica]
MKVTTPAPLVVSRSFKDEKGSLRWQSSVRPSKQMRNGASSTPATKATTPTSLVVSGSFKDRKDSSQRQGSMRPSKQMRQWCIIDIGDYSGTAGCVGVTKARTPTTTLEPVARAMNVTTHASL